MAEVPVPVDVDLRALEGGHACRFEGWPGAPASMPRWRALCVVANGIAAAFPSAFQPHQETTMS